MKCDICSQEFANSQELERHKERMHPIAEEAGESPDMMETPAMNPEMPETENVPEVAQPRST